MNPFFHAKTFFHQNQHYLKSTVLFHETAPLVHETTLLI